MKERIRDVYNFSINWPQKDIKSIQGYPMALQGVASKVFIRVHFMALPWICLQLQLPVFSAAPADIDVPTGWVHGRCDIASNVLIRFVS